MSQTERTMTPAESASTPEIPMLPDGCGYQGYEFGAAYPDSQCFGGRLYDMDSCDGDGNLYEPDEDIPCPMCHPKRAVDYWANRFSELPRAKAIKSAKALVADIRNNRKNGTEPWSLLAARSERQEAK